MILFARTAKYCPAPPISAEHHTVSVTHSGRNFATDCAALAASTFTVSSVSCGSLDRVDSRAVYDAVEGDNVTLTSYEIVLDAVGDGKDVVHGFVTFSYEIADLGLITIAGKVCMMGTSKLL